MLHERELRMKDFYDTLGALSDFIYGETSSHTASIFNTRVRSLLSTAGPLLFKRLSYYIAEASARIVAEFDDPRLSDAEAMQLSMRPQHELDSWWDWTACSHCYDGDVGEYDYGAVYEGPQQHKKTQEVQRSHRHWTALDYALACWRNIQMVLPNVQLHRLVSDEDLPTFMKAHFRFTIWCADFSNVAAGPGQINAEEGNGVADVWPLVRPTLYQLCRVALQRPGLIDIGDYISELRDEFCYASLRERRTYISVYLSIASVFGDLDKDDMYLLVGRMGRSGDAAQRIINTLKYMPFEGLDRVANRLLDGIREERLKHLWWTYGIGCVSYTPADHAEIQLNQC